MDFNSVNGQILDLCPNRPEPGQGRKQRNQKRITRLGGLTRPQRIARHLWRMCMGLAIAAAAFFLGQARLFPGAIRESNVLVVPVLLALLLIIYWVIRVMWSAWPAPLFRRQKVRKAV